MVDECGYDSIKNMSLQAKQACDEGRWLESSKLFDATDAIILNKTNSINIYNVMTKSKYAESNELNSVYSDYEQIQGKLYYMMNDVKTELNLRYDWGEQSSHVSKALEGDFMKPVTKQGIETFYLTTLNYCILYNTHSLI